MRPRSAPTSSASIDRGMARGFRPAPRPAPERTWHLAPIEPGSPICQAVPTMEFAEKPTRGEITRLLEAWNDRDSKAFDRLLPVVMGELRRIARKHFRGEAAGHTLQPTALVNEVYLRLVGAADTVSFENRRQFFGAASRLAREILVDHARARLTRKRGGDWQKVDLDDALGMATRDGLDLEMVLSLDQALAELETVDPDLTRLVELRFFAGLTMVEAAETLGTSLTTTERTWRVAKRRLARALADPDSGRGDTS